MQDKAELLRQAKRQVALRRQKAVIRAEQAAEQALAAVPGLAQAVVSPFAGSKTLLSVEYLGQSDYPTGCESVTAVMALRQAGV